MPKTRAGDGSRWPLALMAVGIVVLGIAGLRLARDGDGAAVVPDVGALASCDVGGCKANADLRPVRGYAVPSLVADADDADHLIVTDVNLVGGVCGWHVTFDGGRTWEDGVFPLPSGYKNCQLDSAGFLSAGNVAWGPSGAVYSVLSSAPVDDRGARTQGESVLLVRSDDGGRTFDPARVVVPGGPVGMSFLRPRVSVVAGPGGVDRLLVSFWECDEDRCPRVHFAQSLDGGATFASPVLLSHDPGGNSPSAPVVDADGAVHVLFLRRYDDGPVDLVHARSSDGGTTFTNTTLDRQQLTGRDYDSPRLAVAPDGRTLYAVASDNRQGRPDVYFRHSDDGGDTWGQAALLSDRSSGGAFLPDVSVSPQGRIDVVYYERSRENVDQVMWAHSFDGGATFERQLQLNDGSIDRDIGYAYEVGDSYGPEVVSTSGTALVVWSDSRLGTVETDTQDTVLRRVEIRERSAPG